MSAHPDEVKREAVRLYETGLSCRAVAKRMEGEGVASPHYLTVLRWAKEAGEGRKTHGRRFLLFGEIVCVPLDKGVCVVAIARPFGGGGTTICNRPHGGGGDSRPRRS